MIERDYFMRMIEMVTAMVARIIGLKDSKDFPQALLEIQNTGKTLLGVDQDLIRRLSASQLMLLFGSDLSVAMPKSYVLAVLLKEKAEIHAMMGEQDESEQLYEKSLGLLVETFLHGGAVEPAHAGLADSVLEKVRHRELPPDLLESVLRYEELLGRYDRAEDMLYARLEIDAGFLDEAMQFYRRLMAKSDKELEAGGLPREEVMEGFAELAGRSR